MNDPSRAALSRSLARLAIGAGWCLALGCGGTLDAGHDREREQLPFGPQNPIVLVNDNTFDNWHGEYALLLAHANGTPLAGIVIGRGSSWQDLDANMQGFQELATRARDSGLTGVPDLVRSEGQPLQRPADGTVESTVPNDSAGARFIVETSLQLAEPGRPLVVATGTRLTDVADAYLLDSTLAERIVVAGSIGTGFSEAEDLAHMGVPNGEEDPWADTIVIQRLPYVQVSARYDQLTDVPSERLSELPSNPFGDWMRAKQAGIFEIEMAADQVSVLAPGIPEFVTDFTRVSQAGWLNDVPTLARDANGGAWVVTASNGGAATARLWELLSDPATFSP
jgi:hypothetical protein